MAQADRLDSLAKAAEQSPKDPPVNIPIIQAGGAVTPQIATLLNDTASRKVALLFATGSLQDAVVAYRQALSEGNTTLGSSLLIQVATAAGTLRGLFQQQAEAYATLKGMLGPLDVSFPTGFVQDYLNDLRAHGFTPDELVTFGQLGLTSDDIARILSDVLALDPLGVPAAFLSILDGEIAFNTTMASNLEPTPEPTTLLLFGTTAAGLALHRWRQRRTKQTAMDN